MSPLQRDGGEVAGRVMEPAAGRGGASSRLTGLGLGLLASVMWGTVFVAGRYLVDTRGLDPMYVAALRFNIGAVAALLFMLAMGKGPDLRNALRELPLLILLGAIGIFGMGSCVFLSLRYTASVNSSIITNANPVFIALFAPLIGERVPPVRVLGLVLGLAGCAVISLQSLGEVRAGDNDLLGGLIAVGAAVCWAAYTVLGKGVSQRRDGLACATICLAAGGLLYLPIVLFRGAAAPLDGTQLAVAILLGVGPSAVAMLAWYKALQYVDASVLGPTQYIATLVGTLLGWWLLSEHIGGAFVVGGAAIVAGLWLATRRNGRAPAS